jgi:hypothetical protein
MLSVDKLVLLNVSQKSGVSMIGIRLTDLETGQVEFSDGVEKKDVDIISLVNVFAEKTYRFIIGKYSPGTKYIGADQSTMDTLLDIDPSMIFNNPQSDFRVKLQLAKGDLSRFKQGDLVTASVESDENCYLYLFYINTQNIVRMIYPNRYTKGENILKKDVVIKVPDDVARVRFKIAGGPGVETLMAIATKKKVNIPEWDGSSKGGDFKEFNKKVVDAFTKELNGLPQDAWASANSKYIIDPSEEESKR